MAADEATITAVEKWFVDRGTPHLIEDYSATRDVLTRALPVLSIVFLLEFTAALDADWRWWQNVPAAAGGFALLLALYAAANRLRGLATWELPSRVGPPELAIFVLLPAVVTAVFGQLRQAVGVAVANALFLLLGIGFLLARLPPRPRGWVRSTMPRRFAGCARAPRRPPWPPRATTPRKRLPSGAAGGATSTSWCS